MFAASSLRGSFTTLGEAFAKSDGGGAVTFQFAGSDALTKQIEEGATPDVVALASKKYATQLAAQVPTFTPFVTNSLVAASPAGNPAKIATLADLARPGLKLVVGAVGVPIGDYARTAVKALDATEGAGFSDRVFANVVSEEPDAASIVAKLRSGDADAGLVYVTDAMPDALPAIPVPSKPAVYLAGVLGKARNGDTAKRFIAFVLSAQGRRILAAAGFGPPPTPTP